MDEEKPYKIWREGNVLHFTYDWKIKDVAEEVLKEVLKDFEEFEAKEKSNAEV